VKEGMIPVVYITPLVAHEKVGGILSIRETLAMTLPVFPARSEKVNVNVPLSVKVCQVKFIPVSGSENPVSVAMTSWLVRVPSMLYMTCAVGEILSMRITCELIIVHVLFILSIE